MNSKFQSIALPGELLKRQRINGDNVPQCSDEQIGTTVTVEPERHFLKLGCKTRCRLLCAEDSSRNPTSSPL
jgi:hypothetical protein